MIRIPMRVLVALGLFVFFPAPPSTRADLLVVEPFDNRVVRYSDAGNYLGNFTSALPSSGFPFSYQLGGIALSPQGDVLIASQVTHQVLKFDGMTGASKGIFSSYFAPGGPGGMTFGPDGDLYVVGAIPGLSTLTAGVMRFDGMTGAFKGMFASSPAFDEAFFVDDAFGLAFGPGGDLFVSMYDRVLRFDGATGAVKDDFASNLLYAAGLTIGPGGDLFVAESRVEFGLVSRFDGASGEPEGTFATMDGIRISQGTFLPSFPSGLAFGPGGDLFVADRNTSRILRFDGVTGASEGVFATQEVDHPTYLLFIPSAVSAVPEPSSLALVATGAGAIGLLLRRRAVR